MESCESVGIRIQHGSRRSTRTLGCERKVIEEIFDELSKTFDKPICTQEESSIGSSMVPGLWLRAPRTLWTRERGDARRETGRLLNISKFVTIFHALDDKGGSASENSQRDGLTI